MPEKTGYGMDAKGARSPSKMPPKKSSKDAGEPGTQHGGPPGPAMLPGPMVPDSGKPSSNRP